MTPNPDPEFPKKPLVEAHILELSREGIFLKQGEAALGES